MNERVKQVIVFLVWAIVILAVAWFLYTIATQHNEYTWMVVSDNKVYYCNYVALGEAGLHLEDCTDGNHVLTGEQISITKRRPAEE